jgi:histidine ammonia-lyase
VRYARDVGSIGASELVVMAVIGLVLLGPPIAVLVWLVRRNRKT